MLVLVAYDVADAKVRARVARTLEGFGTRVQYSVFECRLSEGQLADLLDRLGVAHEQAEAAEDPAFSVRCYRICRRCEPRVTILGQGTLTQDAPYYLI